MQSIQRDLISLGYDPGSANGKMSTPTVVAISKFQSENGLEVTGEATPQLAGILAAKRDAAGGPGAAAKPQSLEEAAGTQASGSRRNLLSRVTRPRISAGCVRLVPAQLETDLAELEFDLDMLQGTISEAECPPGEALVDLEPTTCKPAANDELAATTERSTQYLVSANSSRTGRANCPEGYVATGCGFQMSPSAALFIYNMRTLDGGCNISARNTSSTTQAFYARVTCSLAAPEP